MRSSAKGDGYSRALPVTPFRCTNQSILYLNCKTHYSFRYGTFSTEGRVAVAQEKGATALAFATINATGDGWEFVALRRASGICPMAGAEVGNGDRLLYVLLAANNKSLAGIRGFLSRHLRAKQDFPERTTEPLFLSKRGREPCKAMTASVPFLGR